nr:MULTISPECIES: hypothetical protein [Paracidovorax]
MELTRGYFRWALWLCLIGLFAGCVWYLTTPVLKGSYISPRHVYRVEYYDVSPLKRLIHYDMKIPSFVRLYRIEPETLIGESDVADLWINGQLYWWLNPPVNAVQVGRDIVFENVPPECTDCPLLPQSAVKP